MDNVLVNNLLYYFRDQSSFSPLAIINHKFPQKPIHEALSEIERLDLVTTRGSGPSKSYLLKNPIKEQIKLLPTEFIEKPYEYFLDEEQKKKDAESTHLFHQRENEKTVFVDNPLVKSQRNWAIIIAALSLIANIVLGVLQAKCK